MSENKTQLLNQLAQEIYTNNKAKGFWDEERNIGELLMLITSELGEAMEAHRKGKFTDNSNLNYNSTDDKVNMLLFETQIKDTFEDEIADAIIRLLDLCGGLNIDIDKHISLKLDYNKNRPTLHGKCY